MSSSVKNAARSSRTSTPLRAVARAGYAVNGVVNAVIGFIVSASPSVAAVALTSPGHSAR